jgi:7-cyano-7-deazaguanine synthase
MTDITIPKAEKLPTIVILSGGMDSTVLAYHTAHSGGHELIGCVSVNYGQRHSKELDCAKATCVDLKVPHYLLELSNLRKFISSSALTGDQEVPEGHYAEESMKATVVPNRNMILLALATGVAITKGARVIAYGAHTGDHTIYPDCRPEFAGAMSQAIALCDWEPPTLARPFINISKADIVRMGLSLNVPFDQTWTCYKGGDRACGRCGTCVERLEAFNIVGATDPLTYEDRTSWTSLLEGIKH